MTISAIKTFLTCGYKYYLKYLLKKPSEPDVDSAFYFLTKDLILSLKEDVDLDKLLKSKLSTYSEDIAKSLKETVVEELKTKTNVYVSLADTALEIAKAVKNNETTYDIIRKFSKTKNIYYHSKSSTIEGDCLVIENDDTIYIVSIKISKRTIKLLTKDLLEAAIIYSTNKNKKIILKIISITYDNKGMVSTDISIKDIELQPTLLDKVTVELDKAITNINNCTTNSSFTVNENIYCSKCEYQLDCIQNYIDSINNIL